MGRSDNRPPIAPAKGLPIVKSQLLEMQSLAAAAALRNTTSSRTDGKSAVALAAADSDKTISGSSTPNKGGPNFWPSKPDLAACCQNVAAFLATRAAKSSTNGENPVPTPNTIYEYMRVLFFALQLEPECSVYAYIYIKRLLSGVGNPLRIRPGNWKKLIVGTCLLASKFVDDLSMKNRDFAKALNGWSLARLNRLEFNILTALQWRVYVPISEYTLRYFELAGPRPSTSD